MRYLQIFTRLWHFHAWNVECKVFGDFFALEIMIEVVIEFRVNVIE